LVELRADEMFGCLERFGVRYVVIGGLAGILHGSPLVTFDADICPETGRANLEKLANALREMGARIRTSGVPEGLPFACDAPFLERVAMLNLVTRLGDLDLSFHPSGTGGFKDLISRAQTMNVKGSSVPVAALEDVIRSKEAAARPKDQRALPVLRQLLQEIQARKQDGGKSSS
jgi:hypothetical protein